MEHSPVKIGWRQILGMFVLVTTMPYFAHAQQYESIVVPRGDLPDRLDNTLGELGATRQPVDAHDEWAMGDGPAPVKSAADLIDNGIWYAETDFTVMHRSRAGEVILGIDRQNGQDFTTRNRDMGIQPGARITFGRFFPRDDENRDRSFEFTFIGLNTWEVPQSLRSTNSGSITTALGDTVGGFLDSDQYTSLYHSSFNSFELNYRIGNRLGRDRMVLQPDGCWRRECDPGPLHATILGLRMIDIHENYRWLSRRDDFPTDEYRGDFLVKTDNPLLGLQFGLDCYEQYCKWSYGVRGKGGIYANFSSQDTHVIENRPVLDNNGDVTSVDRLDRRYSQTEPAPAFLGEIALTAGYQLTPRWTLNAEYNFMFFQGLALAPEQVTFDLNEPTPPIINDGWAIYQSLTVGMQFVW